MGKNPAKDFGQIADDYAFFETHATEAQNDAAAYVRRLQTIRPAGNLRMLDFGCGSGRFTAQFLKATDWPPDGVRLTLVEPVEAARAAAVARLAPFTTQAIADSPSLSPGLEGSFEVVLSNHVLYYVPALKERLAELIAAVAPGGVFVTAIAGLSNALIGIWTTAFGLLGRELPYNVADDVEVSLAQLGVNFEKEHVPYELIFDDTEENRMKILRFLLAEYLADVPREPLWELLDRYRDGNRIAISTASEHFTVRKG